jgi:ribonuclease III
MRSTEAISTADDAADCTALEATLGHTFADPNLLQMALTHRSYVYETPGAPNITNERLEFLGDAILAAVTAEYLYRTYPQMSEGELTAVRAALVKAPTLAEFARVIDLGAYLRLGHGEAITGGRDREPLLAAALEAVIGALHLDGGSGVAAAFILRHIIPAAEQFVTTRRYKDDKSIFQELVQRRLGATPVYVVVSTDGPSHQRTYAVEVRVKDVVAGRGAGTSKQRAEREAARDALSHEGWAVTEQPDVSQ